MGLVLRVYSLGFMVHGLSWYGVWGLGFGVWGLKIEGFETCVAPERSLVERHRPSKSSWEELFSRNEQVFTYHTVG